MKFKVLRDFKGAPNGCVVVDYKKGDEVDLTDSLAEVALAEKWVARIKESKSTKAVAALQEELALLEAEYKTAPEAEKPGIKAALEAKQAEMLALPTS